MHPLLVFCHYKTVYKSVVMQKTILMHPFLSRYILMNNVYFVPICLTAVWARILFA